MAKLRFVEFRYRWTGKGREFDPTVLPHENAAAPQLHGPIVKDGEERIYLVDLGRDVSFGDLETVCVQQELIDQEGVFQPFFGYQVREPLDFLQLTVDLPTALQRNIYAEVRDMVSDAKRRLLDAIRHEPGTSLFSVTVQQPEVGHRYGIYWHG